MQKHFTFMKMKLCWKFMADQRKTFGSRCESINYRRQCKSICLLKDTIPVRLMVLPTEWQWPISGVHSIMRVKSALASEGCSPILVHHIYHHWQRKLQCTLQLRGWTGYTPPNSSLPLHILCDQKEGVGNLDFWPCMTYIIWVVIIRRL